MALGRATTGPDRRLGPELDEATDPRADERNGPSISDVRDFADSVDVAPTPSVSVVVRARRDQAPLERCLRSILACRYDDFEVIVVECTSDSLDTARMLVRQFTAERRLRYVEEPHTSASRARNAGLARAEGEIVAFVDDDIVVDPEWLSASVQTLLSEEGIACVTGLLLPPHLENRAEPLVERSAGMRSGFRRRIYRAPGSGQEAGHVTRPPVAWTLLPLAAGALGSGASIVMLTEVARELGGFDPALGPATPTISGENLDLVVRLLQAGHLVSYEPRAIVWSDQTRRLGRLRRRVYRRAVGLGAVLGKHVIAGPKRGEFLRGAPAGLRRLRDPESHETARRPPGYSSDLVWFERLGTLVGVIAYILSALIVAMRQLAATPAPGSRPLRLVRRMVVRGEPVSVVWFRDAQARTARFSWRRAAERDTAGPPNPVVLGAAVTCAAAPLLVLFAAPAAVRLPFLVALLCVVPGVAWLTAVRGPAEPGLVLAISTAVSAVLAQSMLWLGAWRPRPFLYGLAAVCLVPLARRLTTTGGPLPDRASVDRWRSNLRLTGPAVKPATGSHALVIVAALAVWATSLAGADLGRIDGVGLLGAMPPAYFVSLALLLVGFAVAVTRTESRPRVLGGYVLALIVVIHATTAILYDEPRYAWTYPHLGVINLIVATGHADRSVDIYTNWPSFFAVNAWLSTASGVGAIAYAGWAQLAFNLFNVFALRFALRALTRDERVLWTAALFFVIGNWVGQDYLAPQAFAFALSVVVLGLCLRCGRIRATTAPLASGPALVIGAVCVVAIVTSHQLSPVVLILSVFLLALVTRAVPLWIPVAMVGLELGWVILAWPFLHAHFSLVDPGSGGASPSGRDLSAALPGAALSAYAPVLVMALIIALGLAGWIRRLVHGKLDLVAACLISAPVAAVVGQSDGGEGLFRAYLFALPWLAFLAALACAKRLSSPGAGLMSLPRLLIAVPAVCAALLFAYFGEDLANRETPDDVRASTWYELHAPAGSVRINLAPNAPDRLTARYPVTSLGDPPALLLRPQFTGHRLGAADIPRLDEVIAKQGPHPVYVVLSVSQADYGRLNGLIPKGSLAGLRQAITRSGQFRLVYNNPTAWIFSYAPHPAS